LPTFSVYIFLFLKADGVQMLALACGPPGRGSTNHRLEPLC